MPIKWEQVLKSLQGSSVAILAREDAEFPFGALEAHRWNDGKVTLNAMGGGFSLKPTVLDSHPFRLATPEETAMSPEAVPWKRGWFCIDQSPVFGGWTQGESWNGWACPYFELGEARRVAEYFLDDEGKPGRYDPDRDAFVYPSQEEGEEDVYGSTEIQTPEGPRKVYGIGTSYWTWDHETCPGCATPGVEPHDHDCAVVQDPRGEYATTARLRDIKGLWDMWGFGERDSVSDPLYSWLKDEVERRSR